MSLLAELMVQPGGAAACTNSITVPAGIGVASVPVKLTLEMMLVPLTGSA